ncbi:MAG: phosphopentomutase [Bryobacteraceae bacterium]
MSFRRIVLVVFDSLGVGEAPDAAAYGDAGSDTLGHIAASRPLQLPNLRALGIANIRPLAHLAPAAEPLACYGRCAPASPGKDTTTGHWEIAGIHLERPFPLYPNGFPPEVLNEFERRIGRRVLGNCPASGTEIIQRLGKEHMRTRSPIVYTSADSVFQVAAHEEVVPLEELYRMCKIARDILRGPHQVGRVIARPFLGRPGAFERDNTARHDYAVPPPEGMLLDLLAARGAPVWSVGKIHDIFLGRGILHAAHTKDNAEGMREILKAMSAAPDGLIFANLVDFDMLYGHRNDVEGYARALEAADAWIPSVLEALRDDDLFLITADHGNDPATPSSDHNREYVPLLAYGHKAKQGVNLGTRASLADIGQTVAHNFDLILKKGTSFLEAIL